MDRDGKPKINEVTKQQEDPLGWIAAMPIGEGLRPGRVHWLSWVGALGLLIAFGHSILAMSGEETLAQVYREVRPPSSRTSSGRPSSSSSTASRSRASSASSP